MLLKRRQLLVGTLAGAAVWDPAHSSPLAKLDVPVRILSRFAPLLAVDLLAPLTVVGSNGKALSLPKGVWRLHSTHGSVQLQPHSGKHDPSPQPLQFQANLDIPVLSGIRPVQDPTWRRYRGQLHIALTPSGELDLTQWIPLEAYVRGVVPGEMPSDWPVEALQAQAVLARTLVIPWLARRSSRPVRRIQDSTADQFYGGMTVETTATTAAVFATRGQILTRRGADPVQVLFHSTCGGHTSANQDVFAPPALPYLQGVACQYCRDSPFFGPHRIRLSTAEVEQVFGQGSLQILAQDPWGRPTRIQVGSQTLTGQDFWLQLGAKLGWGKLPGNRYTLVQTDPGQYALQVQGAGHGVGLCQWGARGLALAGKSVEEILAFYFPGTQLSRIR